MNAMLAWLLIGGASASILLLVWALLRAAAWADGDAEARDDEWYPG